MAARYVWTEARRNRRDVCVGIWTIALVVGFMSLLQVLCCVCCVLFTLLPLTMQAMQAAIGVMPVLFIGIAEAQVGAVDLVFTASSVSWCAPCPLVSVTLTTTTTTTTLRSRLLPSPWSTTRTWSACWRVTPLFKALHLAGLAWVVSPTRTTRC